MARARTEVIIVNEEDNGKSCAVSPANVRREIDRMKRTGWELISREPADETLLVMEVVLTFRKAAG